MPRKAVKETFSAKVDNVLTHRFAGPLIFVGVMYAIYYLAINTVKYRVISLSDKSLYKISEFVDIDDDFETTKDDKTYYDLGLMEYTGKVMDLRTNSIKEVTAADNYYLDEDGELYQYSWDDDDFYYDNNLVPIS